jgi:hypothetical protein
MLGLVTQKLYRNWEKERDVCFIITYLRVSSILFLRTVVIKNILHWAIYMASGEIQILYYSLTKVHYKIRSHIRLTSKDHY